MNGLLWSCVGYVAGLGLHEAGHAAGGWLAGIETRVLSIGFGPVLWKLRFRETDLVIHAVPLGGFVQYFHPMRPAKAGFIFGTAAGPLSTVLFFLVLLYLRDTFDLEQPMSDILTMLASVQIYIFALTMFPCRYENGDASDGLLIFNLARSPNGEESSRWVAFYESCVRRYAPDGRVEIRNKPAAARLAFHAAVTLQSLDETACAQSAAALEREWQRGAMSAPEEVFLLDLLATGALMRRWPAGPQTLDAWSGRMVALAPGNASAMGTAGACLVVLGRFAAGRAHLTLSYEAAGGEHFDRFLETLFLARAACGEENAAMALTWLEKAQAAQTELEGLNPMPPYVKYTTAMLARTQAAINAGDDRAGRDTPLQDSGSRAPVI